MATKKKAEPNLVPAVRLETDPPALDPFVDDAAGGNICAGCLFERGLFLECPRRGIDNHALCMLERPGCPDGVIWRKKPVYGNEED